MLHQVNKDPDALEIGPHRDALVGPVDAGGRRMVGHHGAEATLGYYIFSRKGADGSFGSYGTGRAVVYLPSNGKG